HREVALIQRLSPPARPIGRLRFGRGRRRSVRFSRGFRRNGMMEKWFSCEAVRDDLKALRDGELSPLRRALVRRHVEQCAACREEMNVMEQIENQLREAESALAPGAAAA